MMLVERIRVLADWHDRQAKVKRISAGRESDPIARAALLGNADTHYVAAAVLRRVLEGKTVEGDE
jgi:hypothetical protein